MQTNQTQRNVEIYVSLFRIDDIGLIEKILIQFFSPEIDQILWRNCFPKKK